LSQKLPHAETLVCVAETGTVTQLEYAVTDRADDDEELHVLAEQML